MVLIQALLTFQDRECVIIVVNSGEEKLEPLGIIRPRVVEGGGGLHDIVQDD